MMQSQPPFSPFNRRAVLLAGAASAALAMPFAAVSTAPAVEPLLELAKRWRATDRARGETNAKVHAAERAFVKKNGRPPELVATAAVKEAWWRDHNEALGSLIDEDRRAEAAVASLCEAIINTAATTPAGIAAKLEVAMAYSASSHDPGEDYSWAFILAAKADAERLAGGAA